MLRQSIKSALLLMLLLLLLLPKKPHDVDGAGALGSGTLRSMNGSKQLLVYPQVPHMTVLQNCPVNMSLTMLPFRAKKFCHIRDAFSPKLRSCSFPSSKE
jgi:hypothetical protein